MTDETRPDPDTLLSHVQKAEEKKGAGRLKIFLGYAAGVGKTYEMLKAAHQLLSEGVDVRIGYVEAHKRPETQKLIAGIPQIPLKKIEYRTTLLYEPDLDAILADKPQVVLIDELAHTNAPGSRHTKRYMDVEEILTYGIDVYTTLNIQHLDSLRDVVAQITHIQVHETVPDRVIDEADEIKLVDLPPAELIQRLHDGKVYVPEMAEQAVRKFFSEGNLHALREISLRKVAKQVDGQMVAYMQTRSIPGPWPATERLLISIGPSPFSERLVRTARRQADRMNVDWTVLYVETPKTRALPKEDKERIWKSMKLAESLGAKADTVFAFSVPDAIISYAKKHNVTRIILGKTLRPRWKELLFGSIVDDIIHKSGDIDVYIVSQNEEYEKHVPKSRESLRPEMTAAGIAESILLVAAAVLVGEFAKAYISESALILLFFAVVILSAIRRGLLTAVLSAVLSILVFDFFLVHPYYTFHVFDPSGMVLICGMLAIGIVLSRLIARSREDAAAARSREHESAMLYRMSQKLAGTTMVSEVADVLTSSVRENFGWETIVLVPGGTGLVPIPVENGAVIDEKDLAVAFWAFMNIEVAGYDTDTLHSSSFRFVPIRTPERVLGVLGVRPTDVDGVISPDTGRILTAFADLAGLAMGRVFREADADV